MNGSKGAFPSKRAFALCCSAFPEFYEKSAFAFRMPLMPKRLSVSLLKAKGRRSLNGLWHGEGPIASEGVLDDCDISRAGGFDELSPVFQGFAEHMIQVVD